MKKYLLLKIVYMPVNYNIAVSFLLFAYKNHNVGAVASIFLAIFTILFAKIIATGLEFKIQYKITGSILINCDRTTSFSLFCL